MEIIKIEASTRSQFGKTASAKLRTSGKVPAIVYGKGIQSTALAIAPKAIQQVFKSAHGLNTVVELDVSDNEAKNAPNKITVLVKDTSHHPVSRELTHVDFIQISLENEVDVEVPFVTTGKSTGITLGGLLRIVYRTLPVRCLPTKTPVKIEYDITNVGLNEAVKASQLKLPEGVKVRLPEEQTVAAIVSPEKEKGEEAAVATTAAPAAGAKPAAAAAKPAAGAAKTAAAAAKPAAPAKKK